MSATKRKKRSKKSVRFEVSRLALAGWGLGLFLALLWMFLLGLFVGKGITPANINLAEIKKRMVAEGIWPGSSKPAQQEKPSATTNTKKKIPLKDLEFYEKLAKKKKAQQQSPPKADSPVQKKASTVQLEFKLKEFVFLYTKLVDGNCPNIFGQVYVSVLMQDYTHRSCTRLHYNTLQEFK